MGEAGYRVVGPVRFAVGALCWKFGGPVYEMLAGAGDLWATRAVGRPLGICASEKEIEAAGYLEVVALPDGDGGE